MKNNFGIWLETTAQYCELCGYEWFVRGRFHDSNPRHADDCPIRLADLEGEQT